ncbi:pilus (MSHA type) biogenesis protein MshL [Hahella sp. CCB-MM4]|uniref:pilus (MSHA type) biogenesis protein MshL n=1 Tax=Hahella sp. (strain CCB-MM4) TaxID=1926491 RepID=UPI000B9BDA3F|nr:pilus (MSHA type) biogenesis protein MshL [Hahella sp. CCB-MM4]OZG70856.1 pilus (MSHA type) biogenesis protein MshL [Hahella sp. CCB-MM4]
MIRFWRTLCGGAMALVLGACAGIGPSPVSTDNTQHIEEQLREAQHSQAPAKPDAPPRAVTRELIPPLNATSRLPEAEERFDITVNELPAKEFFRGLVRGTPYNMVVHPDVTGTVSLDLKNVTLAQVMELARQLYGYDYKYSDGIYKVLPGGIRTEIYQINYLNIKRRGASDIMVSSGQLSSSVSGSSAGGSSDNNNNATTTSNAVLSRITTETESDFWSTLQQTLLTIVGDDDGRSVVTNASAGIVLVKALPEELRSVEDFLKRSQLILQRQVILEAKVLEVELSKGYEQGINWSYFDEFSSQLDLNGDPTKSLTLGQTSDALTNTGIEGIFSAALRINDFTTLIQLLGKQGSVQVLSSPRIATINNQKAVIKVGTDEFFVTGIQTNDSNNSDETSTEVDITPFFSGIALDVTPQIGDDGDITLHVHPTVSDVEDQTKTIVIGNRSLILPLALSTVRETDSVIKARNGQVVVIGGLIQNITEDDSAEVPLLADIPWLGEAFKQKRQSERKSELVILIRPIISDPSVVNSDLQKSEGRFNELRNVIERDYR